MRTLAIRVPYTPNRPGHDGPDGRPVGLVILHLHEGADVERFEDAAGEAEGDLAAALLLQRQAERAAAARRPWAAATKDMRARAILDADLALQAAAWAGKVGENARKARKKGELSGKVRRTNRDTILAQVAPLFAAAKKALRDMCRKRQGEREISRQARERAILTAGGDPKKLPAGLPNKLSSATIRRAGGKPEAAPLGFEYLTESYARNWLAQR